MLVGYEFFWAYVITIKGLKNFNSIAKPLTRLTHIDQEFIWDEPQEQAFEELKTKLSSTHILR
jgi:hypothetical protein